MAPVPAAPLRPWGSAEILDAAVRLVRRNARAALWIAVPFAIVRSALSALVQFATIDSKDATTVATFGDLLLAVMFGVLLTGLLTPLLSADLLGAPISARAALRRVGRAGWTLAGLSILVMVAEAVGLAAFVVGGVWLWGVWAVAAPALVLERTSVGGALRRSLALVRGAFWRTWGIRALGWLLTLVLGLLIVLPFDALAAYLSGANPFDSTPSADHPALYVSVLGMGAVVSAAVLSPVSAAIDILIYTDLRMRKEGMDIALGMPNAEHPTAVPAW